MLDLVWMVTVVAEVTVVVEVMVVAEAVVEVEVTVAVEVLVAASIGEIVAWDSSDLQRHPHHQHPYHHPLEIAFGLLVTGDDC